MYYAGYDKETDWSDVAVFQTEEERDRWLRCEIIDGMNDRDRDYYDDALFERELLTERDVVQRFGLDSASEIEALDSYEEEMEGVRYLTVAGMDGWKW